MSQTGKQRYFCYCCHKFFVHSKLGVKYFRQKIWFKLWIKEGYSLRQIKDQSGRGLRQLKKIVQYWLSKVPELDSIKRKAKKSKYLIFDGTYLNKKRCVLGLIDNTTDTVLNITYGKGEKYNICCQIFKELKDKFNLNPIAITLDGNTNVIKAVKTVWTNIIVQRCLVHIQRQGLSWLRRKPKLVLSCELRTLFLTVTKIKTRQEKELFIKTFYSWLKCHESVINSFSKTDKVLSDFLRAKSLLVHAIPDMFYYLDDKKIPSTTNKMEGFFSRLKEHYRKHRGLRLENRISYFTWYWYYLSKSY